MGVLADTKLRWITIVPEDTGMPVKLIAAVQYMIDFHCKGTDPFEIELALEFLLSVQKQRHATPPREGE